MIPRVHREAHPSSSNLRQLIVLLPVLAVVLVAWLGISAPTVPLHASTVVAGIIRESVVWTVDKSPYHLTDKIQVSEGVTLTIEPGVIVDGNGHAIQVWGTLEINGTAQNRVRIADTHIEPGNNQYDAPRFVITITGAEIIGGSVYRQTGNAIYGTLELTDSILRKTTDPVVLWYPTSPVTIERNVFDNTCGIVAITDVVISIQDNVFFQQMCWKPYIGAINLVASYWVEPIIRYNSFLSTDRVAIWIDTPYTHDTVDATGNFWNTLDQDAIADMIFDRNDDLAAPSEVLYKPYLSQRHAMTPPVALLEPTPTPTDAPTPTNTPTPTATPLSLLLPSLRS
jgi:hypothetical protein